MKLNTKGRYAVMAMVDLAANCNETGEGHNGVSALRCRPIPLAEIAERQEISLSYLEQLFAKLRRGALVQSVRGPGGGYLLARAAEDTRIADIILAVDEPIRATRCMPGQPVGCRGNSSRCLTHDLWEELGNQIYLYLNSVSLADVVARRVLGTSGLFATACFGEPPQPDLAAEVETDTCQTSNLDENDPAHAAE
ncbi:Rrf2 family transcriptional regulator [Pelagibius sp. Alg239-R121]|uniref:Rrf2 family transcriptional regulator n=1 Tax=Pelagibius sp. Alg239-R121 TaxID=2993448 RepID=UPI0024A7332E|nr:Rrf2 family transcriptional regulator [Pelagibius sp. Alg239-R121]